VLITTDYDRTLTAPDTSIPPQNLEAIRYFMDNGGAFTVNTGRTVPTSGKLMAAVPANAPFLLYNGSAAYDPDSGKFLFAHEIQLDWREVRQKILYRFPSVWFEFQGAKAHYLLRKHPMWEAFCEHNHCPWAYAEVTDDLGPFLKFCVYERISDVTVDHLFHGTAEEIARMDEVEAWLKETFGESCMIVRGADLYIDVQPIGVSKGRSARELKEALGRKILICIGDAENDVSMLDAADYAFCPSDGILKDQYPNVCACSKGAVADVIYNCIPNL
jgi:HAD superfamily hydrolase (TIGR01484 family)